MKTKWKVLILVSLLIFVTLGIIGSIALVGEFNENEMPFFGNKIAIVPIKGYITTESCGPSMIGGTQCAEVAVVKSRIRSAESDPSIRAIVLDINSGGGSVVATGEIEEAVRNCNKPVVAWVEEVGASGAYYVASAADVVVADRNSMVGNIGVIMTVPHYYGLLGMIGVNMTVIKAGNSKDIGSPYREMTEGEEGDLQGMVNKIYYDFVSGVAENRGLSAEYVENISDGSIYLGSEAQEIGLVDVLGGRSTAIEIAAELGGIEGTPGIVETRPKKNLVDLLSEMSTHMGYGIGKGIISEYGDQRWAE